MEKALCETSGAVLRLKAFSDFQRGGRGRPLASLIADAPRRAAVPIPTASRASRHRLHNADSGPAFPDSSPLPRARHRSPGPRFLCLSLSRGQKQAEAAAPCSRDTRPGHRRARPGREGRRAATRKRIHIETLSHVLDEVGRLLAVRQLFIRFHSAAAARRVLQLFSSKEPARRSSTARRHDTSSSARTLSPPPPLRPRGLRAKASRPRPNALAVDFVTPFPVLPLPVRMRPVLPAGSHWSFAFSFRCPASLRPAGPQCSAPPVIGKAPKAGVTRKEKVDAVHAGPGRGVRRRGGANGERSCGCAVGFGRLRSMSLRVH